MKRLGLLDLVDNLSKKTRCLLKKKFCYVSRERKSNRSSISLCRATIIACNSERVNIYLKYYILFSLKLVIKFLHL